MGIAPEPSLRRTTDLACLVIQAQDLGVIEGWRDYIEHEQQLAGISNQALKAAIDQEKKK